MIKKILKDEDWLSFGIGLIIVLLAVAGIRFGSPKYEWKSLPALLNIFSDGPNLLNIGLTFVVILILGLLTKILRPKGNLSVLTGMFFLFIVAVISMVVRDMDQLNIMV